MGLAFSNATTKVVQDTVQAVSQTCKPTTDQQQKMVCKSTADHCDNFSQICQQNATSNSKCDESVVEDAAAKSMIDSSSSAKGGFGIVGSDSYSQQVQNLKNITNQQCSPTTLQSQDLYSELSCIGSSNATNTSIQNMDAMTTCKLNAIASALNDAYAKVKSDATAYNPLGFLDNISQAIVYGVIAIVAVVVIVKLVQVFRGGGEPAPASVSESPQASVSTSPPEQQYRSSPPSVPHKVREHAEKMLRYNPGPVRRRG